MADRVAGRPNDARDAVLIDTEKTVRCAGRYHRIQRDLQASIRPVFKSHRHGKAARHFAVGLRFGGARADSSPTNQVVDILRDNGIEKLRGNRKSDFIDIQQQSAGSF